MLAAIPEGRAVSIERETFPALVECGSLFALASDGYWVDAGTPATYLRANLDLRGDVPVLLGEGATIDPGATVERSVIGPGARVEAGASVIGLRGAGRRGGGRGRRAASLHRRRQATVERRRPPELSVLGQPVGD